MNPDRFTDTLGRGLRTLWSKGWRGYCVDMEHETLISFSGDIAVECGGFVDPAGRPQPTLGLRRAVSVGQDPDTGPFSGAYPDRNIAAVPRPTRPRMDSEHEDGYPLEAVPEDRT